MYSIQTLFHQYAIETKVEESGESKPLTAVPNSIQAPDLPPCSGPTIFTPILRHAVPPLSARYSGQTPIDCRLIAISRIKFSLAMSLTAEAPSIQALDAEYPTTLKVAVVQFAPVTGVEDATANNLERMSMFVEKAWRAGAKLIVFPELGTCGYGIETEEVHRAVEAAPHVISVRPMLIYLNV